MNFFEYGDGSGATMLVGGSQQTELQMHGMLDRLVGKEVRDLFLDFGLLDGSTGLEQAEHWPPEGGERPYDCGVRGPNL